jgi:hypothetical protein
MESIAVECTVCSTDTSKKVEGKFQTLSTATMVHFKQQVPSADHYPHDSLLLGVTDRPYECLHHRNVF